MGAKRRTAPAALVSNATLWFGLFAGHVAWSLQLMIGYYLSSVLCPAGPNLQWFLWLALHLATVLAAGVTAAAALLSYRGWRRAQATPPAVGQAGGPQVVGRRAHFMALSGVLLSALYLLVILMNGAANFFVSPCP